MNKENQHKEVSPYGVVVSDGISLYNGDCLEVMDYLISQNIKVDAIITDPPYGWYGTTACKWDSVIPFDEMWERSNRLIKPNGAVVLFGSEPFSSALRMSNIKEYKYDWIWVKNKCSNHLNSKFQPLKMNELVLVFSKMASSYSPLGNMAYYPQDIIVLENPKKQKRNGKVSETFHTNPNIETLQKFSNYPKNILFYNVVNKPIHPTQKPVDLLEYLVKTYTNEGDTVLDFTMGSGSTGVACVNTNRKFIGIELDKGYFEISQDRICEAIQSEE